MSEEETKVEEDTKVEEAISGIDKILDEFIETGDATPEELDDVLTEEEQDKHSDELEDGEEEPTSDEVDLYPDDEDEDDDETELSLDDASDQELADIAFTADTFDELIKAAHENDIQLDDRFVAMIARSGVDPNFFAQHKIFKPSDFVNVVQNLESQVDPTNIIYPHKGTPEQIAEFQEQYENIPSEADGYTDEIFTDTLFETDEKVKGNFREYLHENRFSREQARTLVEFMDNERRYVTEEMEKDMMGYVKGQINTIEKTFKGDAEKQMRDIGKLMWKHGRGFAQEFKGTKALKSASFFNFMSNLLDAGDAAGRFTISDFRKIVEGGKTENRGPEWFKGMLDKVLKHPHYTDQYKNSPDAAKKRAWKRLEHIHSTLRRAATSRGFDI